MEKKREFQCQEGERRRREGFRCRDEKGGAHPVWVPSLRGGYILDHFQKCLMYIHANNTQKFKIFTQAQNIHSGHYHTKRKLQLLELPGYQFADPCPPSVRSVAFSISPVVVFIMSFCSVEDLWSLWGGYSLEVPDQGFLDLICTSFFATTCHIFSHLLTC